MSDKKKKISHGIIVYSGMKFVVSGIPKKDHLEDYKKLWKKHNVKHVVRVCEETYTQSDIDDGGFVLHDLYSKDGDVPDDASIDAWISLVEEVYGDPKSRAKKVKKDGEPAADAIEEAIAVHCVAGLGRSPLLVAIALMEYGMGSAMKVVEFVRKNRPNALNAVQINFLKKYKPKSDCIIA